MGFVLIFCLFPTNDRISEQHQLRRDCLDVEINIPWSIDIAVFVLCTKKRSKFQNCRFLVLLAFFTLSFSQLPRDVAGSGEESLEFKSRAKDEKLMLVCSLKIEVLHSNSKNE